MTLHDEYKNNLPPEKWQKIESRARKLKFDLIKKWFLNSAEREHDLEPNSEIPDKYKALLERFLLVPIKDDSHLDKAHEVAQSLILQESKIAPEESDYLVVLLDLIAKYEDEHYPL